MQLVALGWCELTWRCRLNLRELAALQIVQRKRQNSFDFFGRPMLSIDCKKRTTFRGGSWEGVSLVVTHAQAQSCLLSCETVDICDS